MKSETFRLGHKTITLPIFLPKRSSTTIQQSAEEICSGRRSEYERNNGSKVMRIKSQRGPHKIDGRDRHVGVAKKQAYDK